MKISLVLHNKQVYYILSIYLLFKLSILNLRADLCRRIFLAVTRIERKNTLKSFITSM
jgi:hypothetical protein